MLEKLMQLMSDLIVALNANTAALGGAAPAAAGKKTRGKAADTTTETATAVDPATPAPEKAPEKAAEVIVTKEQILAAGEALRDAGGVPQLRAIKAKYVGEGKVWEAAGTPKGAPVLKELQDALAAIQKDKADSGL